jgi:hypothetical protein
MHNGGADLKEWLTSFAVNARDITEVLFLAIDALIKTAQLNVWHFDVALRNFVVNNDQPSSNKRTVWLIDFGNAICPHFTLQKPLWMRPHINQHPLLQAVLKEDWENFFERHNLVFPIDLHTSFDIPKHIYQNDWVTELKVEALSEKWCVIAHSTGQMLISALRLQPTCLDGYLSKFQELMNLTDDNIAYQKMLSTLEILHLASQEPVDIDKTPRPRINPLAESGNQFIPFERPNIEEISTTENKSKTDEKKVFFGLYFVVLGCLLTFGWWVLDVGYSVSGSKITSLTLISVIGVFFATLICAAGIFISKYKKLWFARLIWIHIIGQALLIYELWILGVNLLALSIMALTPLIAVIFLLAYRHFQKTHNPKINAS